MSRGGALAGAEAVPLHQRIRADIEARILEGTWPPGHRLPPEEALARAYGCSRMTANKAVAALAAAGLVERRRRAGTIVARPHIQSVVLDIPDIQADVVRRGARYGYELLARRVRPANPRSDDELTLAAGGALLAVSCRHLAGGRPFALERRLISLAAVPDAADVDFGATPPGTWLLGHVAWTEAEHRITAARAGRTDGRMLELDPGEPCLVLERHTWRAGEPITSVRQIFPGALYDLVARFRPGA